MIYLNNAGTSWPRPAEVHEAVSGVHQASPEGWSTILEQAHGEIAAFFGVEQPSRFLLTPGCTQALAVAIADLPWRDGDRVITSSLEHHALARPVIKLARERGIEHLVAPYRRDMPVDLEFVARHLGRGGVRLVACTMASNVTGDLLPIAELIDLAHRHDALFLLDGAQAAGTHEIDLRTLGADLFAFAGHKGPLGPQGVGGLYIAPHVAMQSPSATCDISPEGGPASCSTAPSYCDLGSVNLAAVAGLAAGLGWLSRRGQKKVLGHIRERTGELLAGLIELPGVIIHGSRDPARRTSAVSITAESVAPAELASRLRDRAGVVASAGRQCAPMAHDAIGTGECGTLRLSAGPFTTSAEIDATLAALRAVL